MTTRVHGTAAADKMGGHCEVISRSRCVRQDDVDDVAYQRRKSRNQQFDVLPPNPLLPFAHPLCLQRVARWVQVHPQGDE